MIRCESCSNRIVYKASDGSVELRATGRLVVGLDGACRAQCHFCKAEVVLPLEISKSAVIPDRLVVTTEVVRRAVKRST